MKAQIFVISLPQDEQRRRVLSQQLDENNIPFRVFNAVYGKSLSSEELSKSYDARRALRVNGRELSIGEIGCALSHYGVCKRMIEEDIPYVLVLEDDASLEIAGNLSTDTKLVTALEHLEEVVSSTDPSIVLFSYVRNHVAHPSSDLSLGDGFKVYLTQGDASPGRGHAYFITKAAATKLVNKIYPIYTPADAWFDFKRWISVKVLRPYVVGTQSEVASTIGGGRMRERPYSASAALYRKRLKLREDIALSRLGSGEDAPQIVVVRGKPK